MRGNIWVVRKQRTLILLYYLDDYNPCEEHYDLGCLFVKGEWDHEYFSELLCKLLEFSSKLEKLVVTHESYSADINKAAQSNGDFIKSLKKFKLSICERHGVDSPRLLLPIMLQLSENCELELVPVRREDDLCSKCCNGTKPYYSYVSSINDLLDEYLEQQNRFNAKKFGKLNISYPSDMFRGNRKEEVMHFASKLNRIANKIDLNIAHIMEPVGGRSIDDASLNPDEIGTILTQFHNLSHLTMQTTYIKSVDEAKKYREAFESSSCSLDGLELKLLSYRHSEEDFEKMLHEIITGVSSKWPNLYRFKLIFGRGYRVALPLSHFNQIVTSLTNCTTLEFEGFNLPTFQSTATLTTPFKASNAVREFELDDSSPDMYDVSLLGHILKAFPYLKKLTLSMCEWDQGKIPQWMQENNLPTPIEYPCKETLKTLIIKGYEDDIDNQMPRVFSILFKSLPNIRRLAMNYASKCRPEALRKMRHSIKHHLLKLKHFAFFYDYDICSRFDDAYLEDCSFDIKELGSCLLSLKEFYTDLLTMSKENIEYLLQNAPKLKLLSIQGPYSSPGESSEDEDADSQESSSEGESEGSSAESSEGFSAESSQDEDAESNEDSSNEAREEPSTDESSCDESMKDDDAEYQEGPSNEGKEKPRIAEAKRIKKEFQRIFNDYKKKNPDTIIDWKCVKIWYDDDVDPNYCTSYYCDIEPKRSINIFERYY